MPGITVIVPLVFPLVFPRTVLLPRDSSKPNWLTNPRALSVTVQFETRTVPKSIEAVPIWWT